jgi:hypothetical protein
MFCVLICSGVRVSHVLEDPVVPSGRGRQAGIRYSSVFHHHVDKVSIEVNETGVVLGNKSDVNV